MIKNLRYVLIAVLACLGLSNAFAGVITFGELGLQNGVQYADPFDGDDFTVTFGGGGNNGKYYTTGEGIRVYGGGTMTIAAKEGTLKKMVIIYDGTNKPTDATVVNVGTYDAESGVWTGDAESVVFTRPSGSGHWRVKQISTGDDAIIPDKPTEGQQPEDALTVARALEIINALEDGKTTADAYYVKGKVVAIERMSTSNCTFTISADGTDANTVKVYNAKGLQNKDIADQSFIKTGDDVIVVGVLQKYVKNEVVTPEVSSGYVYSVNGKTEAETVPEPVVEGGTTPETAITVAAAIQAINSMIDGQLSTDSFYVKGIVTGITEISTTNGNATFNFADNAESKTSLIAYRLHGLQKKSITNAELFKVGDEVIVFARLQKYVKDDVTTPEMSKGYIYSINGKTEEEVQPIELTGDGSKENPYTVEDLQKMPVPTASAAEEGQQMVWVKGFIAGSMNSSASAILEEAVASNIGLAATAEEGDATKMIPVQLVNNTEVRTAVNVADNPTNVGKEIFVYGYILKYMGRTGIKNTTAAVLDNQEISGISELTAGDRFQGAIYNLRGQRISTPAKGMYIRDGKKFVVK